MPIINKEWIPWILLALSNRVAIGNVEKLAYLFCRIYLKKSLNSAIAFDNYCHPTINAIVSVLYKCYSCFEITFHPNPLYCFQMIVQFLYSSFTVRLTIARRFWGRLQLCLRLKISSIFESTALCLLDIRWVLACTCYLWNYSEVEGLKWIAFTSRRWSTGLSWQQEIKWRDLYTLEALLPQCLV